MEIPYVFQPEVREKYFKMFTRFSDGVGLVLDLANYKEAVLLASQKGFLEKSQIVGVVESNSQYGSPDDLSNELTPKGLNKRLYDGLKIAVVDKKYLKVIEVIAANMGSYLGEKAVVEDRSSEAESLINSVLPESWREFCDIRSNRN